MKNRLRKSFLCLLAAAVCLPLVLVIAFAVAPKIQKENAYAEEVHNYGNPNWTWNGTVGASVTFKCQNAGCDEIYYKTAQKITSQDKVAASCEVNGQIEYTATFTVPAADQKHFAETTYYTSKLEPNGKNALGHRFVTTDDDWHWNFDGENTTVTVDFVCTREDCQYNESQWEVDEEGETIPNYKTVDFEVTSEVVTSATCTEVGETKYTATYSLPFEDKHFVEKYFEKERTVADIPALGHDIDRLKVTVEPKTAYIAFDHFESEGMEVHTQCGRCEETFDKVEEFTVSCQNGEVLHAVDEYVTVSGNVTVDEEEKTLSAQLPVTVDKKPVTVVWEYSKGSQGTQAWVWNAIAADTGLPYDVDGTDRALYVRASFQADDADENDDVHGGSYSYRGSNSKVLITKGGDEVTEMVNGGTYTLALDADKFGDYELDNNSVEFKITKIAIDLSNENNFYWMSQSNGAVLLDGYIDSAYKYYSEAGEGRTYVKHSIVRSRGGNTVIEIFGKHSYLYEIAYEDCEGNESGKYNATATLTILEENIDNYKFVLYTNPDADRHITFDINADGTVAEVGKEWYIAQIDNSLLNEQDEEWSLSGWTFANYQAQSAPLLEHGDEDYDGQFADDDNKVTFELFKIEIGTNNAVEHVKIGETFKRSQFADYINSSVPAGDYILKVYVSSVESYDGFNCGFAFTVEEAEFVFDDSELNENTFTYAYNAQMHLYKNVELPEEALLVSADDREGVWKNLNQYYGEAYLTYNLLRWNTGNYVTKAEMEQLSHPKEKPVAVDTYTVYYKLCAPNFKQTDAGKYFTVVIDKAGIRIPAVFERTYNGSELSYEVEAGALYSLVGTAVYINAGEYDVTLRLDDSNNYAWVNADGQLTESATATAKFVIAKADFDMDGVTFDGLTVPYDGAEHSLAVVGLPDELEVTYDNNGQVNAKTYTVTAIFTFKDADFGKNYKDITPMTAELVITKIDYVIEGDPIIFDNGSVPYDGAEHSLAVGNLPDVLEVTYEHNGQINADTYTVTAKFTFKDPVMAGNYNEIPSMSATLTITPVDYDISKITFADQTKRYTGSPINIAIDDLPEELEATYKNNGQTIVGEYTVIASFTLKGIAAQNYNPITDTLSAKLTILKAQIKIPATQTTYHKDGQSHTYQVAADAPYTVENGEEYTALGEYDVTLKLKDTHNYEWVDDEGNVISSATVSAKFIVAERPQLPIWVWIAAGGGVLAIVVLIVVIVVVKKKKNANPAKKK